MMIPNQAQLNNSLTYNDITRTKITKTQTRTWLIDAATGYWIKRHRGGGWIQVRIALSQHTEVIKEVTDQRTYTHRLPPLTNPSVLHSHLGINRPLILFIIEFDRWTPQYIFEAAEFFTHHPTSRILAIEWDTKVR
jgi:hypothetical protein